MPQLTQRVPPFPVIVGVPRSGTTLLRLMLDAHPQLAIPPETGFLLSEQISNDQTLPKERARLLTQYPENAPAWADFAMDTPELIGAAAALPADASVGEVLRLFYGQYAAHHGKPRAGDKTPIYLTHMRRIAKHLPEARFIHILRDGRDVALSWQQTWFAPERELPSLVRRWAQMIAEARMQASDVNYLEIRYDHLLTDPARELQRICRFIDLEYHPAMQAYHTGASSRLAEHKARFHRNGQLLVSHEQRLNQQWRTTLPPDTGRLGVWRRQLTTDEQKACTEAGGQLLGEFC